MIINRMKHSKEVKKDSNSSFGVLKQEESLMISNKVNVIIEANRDGSYSFLLQNGSNIQLRENSILYSDLNGETQRKEDFKKENRFVFFGEKQGEKEIINGEHIKNIYMITHKKKIKIRESDTNNFVCESNGRYLLMEIGNDLYYCDLSKESSSSAVISIPQKKYKKIFIRTEEGNINCKGMKAEQIEVETMEGGVCLQNIVAEKSVAVDTSRGTICGSKIKAKEIFLRTLDGNINLDRASTLKLRVYSSSGTQTLREVTVIEKVSIKGLEGNIVTENVDWKEVDIEQFDGEVFIQTKREEEDKDNLLIKNYFYVKLGRD